MRKIKVYQYPDTPQDIYELSGYRDCVPFTKQGVERWCELVEPKGADLFLGGQYHDKNSWMLEPERFEFLKGNEHKHYFDIEGDWAYKTIPGWLHPCIITAMNANPDHRNWSCFVRPGCSNVLMNLLKSPPEFIMPEKIGFFFMGQRDPHGLRERLEQAFIKSGVSGEFIFTNKWNAVSSMDDPDVHRYLEGMARWSFQLCPAGSGQMSVRFFEACAYGRIPVVLANNLLFAERSIDFMPRHHNDASIDVMARWLQQIQTQAESTNRIFLDESFHRAHQFFLKKIRPYFADPTAWLIERMVLCGLLEGK